ncbi:MAG: hypothetical protein GY934_07785, partial [Gammaproteobacteria bacterium]|nr:hypothetical protein [Gammaproteobacteria bacterium]
DGLMDHLDLDADNDGIQDIIEAGGTDSNGDGYADNYDPANPSAFDTGDNDGWSSTYDGDAANDGTTTIVGDGTVLIATNDANNDGDVTDAGDSYPNSDSDGDGNLDHLDLDADNDGIPDIVEAGGIDTNGDGQADNYDPENPTAFDTGDNDGWSSYYDGDASNDGATTTAGDGTDLINNSLTDSATDKDGDGIADHLDLDADNDGIPDIIEVGGVNLTGDGMVDTGAAPWDSDGDGLADVYDTNNNSIAGVGDGGSELVKTTADSNNDGHADASGEGMIAGSGSTYNSINIDGDVTSGGVIIPSHLDLDADNDGILDVTEVGGTDANGDGIFDGGVYGNNGYNNTVDPGDSGSPLIVTNFDSGGDSDSRSEPSPGGFAGAVADTDGDDVPDWLDVDSDNDGIYDNYEAQSTAGYIAPSGTDSDGDGVDDNYDRDDVAFGATTDAIPGGITPYDHDGVINNNPDGIPDHLDLDADGDGICDRQEAWDNVYDGDSSEDNLGGVSCFGTDGDGDGLLECYDADDADATDFSWAGAPADDDGTTDGQTASTGTVFGAGSSLDDLLPDNGSNGGVDPSEPDYRDVLIVDCGVPQVYYAVTEQEAGTSTDFELNPNTLYHVDGNGSGIVRATTFCEPGADGYYYFYNPLEPDNYLFGIKNSAGSPNTVPFDEFLDYIELKVEGTPGNRYAIGQAVGATLVMERDWNVVFKGSPTAGSTFDIKFYFRPEEMQALDAAADAIEATAHNMVRSSLQWFKKPNGLSNSDIDSSGVANMTDITSMATEVFDGNTGVSMDGAAESTDGNSGTTGNGRNYVEFMGLTSFSGGTAMIKMTYSALPVELSRFVGSVDGCNTMLTWTAQAEEAFSHYELEWSGDGNNYQQIGRVEGAGGLDLSQTYQYYDELASVYNYYRLKMIDLDGTYEYSNVVYLQTGCDDEYDLMLYPNPLSIYQGVLNVKLYSEREEIDLIIVDVLGRMVKRTNLSTEQEWNTIRLDVS